MNVELLKYFELLSKQHAVMSHKSWTFSNATMKTQISQSSVIWRCPYPEMWCHAVFYSHSDNDEEAPDSVNIIIIIIIIVDVDDDNRSSRFLWKLEHIYKATLHPIP